jgi:long-chain acyl-CoA synthetase
MTDFDEPTASLSDILDLHARTQPGKPALICGDAELAWGEFGTLVHRCAAALMASGVKPGDVVGLLAEPGIDGVVATFAILRAGATVASLSAMVAADALCAMILNSGARLLMASPHLAPLIDAIRPGLAAISPADYVMLGSAMPGWTSLAVLQADLALPTSWPPLRGRDDLCIIYSSGTTSTPKGIVLSHACRLQNAYSLALEMRYDCKAVILVTTALYSNTAWSLLTTSILVGGTTVIMPKFDAAGFCALVPRYGVSHTTMVPAQFQMIRDCPAQPDANFTTMRTICTVGSTMAHPLKAWAMARFPNALYEVYGLTEGLVTVLKPEDMPTRIASVGRPMIGQDLRILDDHNDELPPGETGEIVGHGPLLMTRYHQNSADTAASLWREPITGRSFLRSGDIGFFDPEGFFHLAGRKKDMIVSGGVNVYPSDIEQVLATHPGISEASVIGVPHPKWGETPLAVVVPHDPALEPDIVRDWANARLGKHQRVSAVVFRTALPRNAGGKVLKRQLTQEVQPR